MTATIDEDAVEGMLERLERARGWSPRLVSKLEALIRGGTDTDLFRINPVRFATDRNLPEAEIVDLFLHAAALGIFEMNWLLLCPVCSCVVESFSALANLTPRYHCVLCRTDFETVLDDYITVTFTVSPAVRSIAYHEPASLPARDYCFRYRLTEDGLYRDGVPWARAWESVLKALSYLPPGATTRLDFTAEPGLLSGFDPDSEAGFLITVAGEPRAGPQRVALRYGAGTCEPAEIRLVPGPVLLDVENATERRGLIGVSMLPEGYEHCALRFGPFLSGKQVLNAQTFRSLFRSDLIRRTEGIGVRDVTILFTDITGSTALYDRIGDLNAFSLVQQHFHLLERVTVAHRGAIVKTIGDAVMAAFSTPVDALRAALAMLEATEQLNAGLHGRSIVLKIGIHRGAAIAVTMNERLDYFGQTVNIAARVQEMVEPEEICLSAAVYDYPGVEPLLGDCRVTPQRGRFRGMDRELHGFRVARAGSM